jgi:hypothetical protein
LRNRWSPGLHRSKGIIAQSSNVTTQQNVVAGFVELAFRRLYGIHGDGRVDSEWKEEGVDDSDLFPEERNQKLDNILKTSSSPGRSSLKSKKKGKNSSEAKTAAEKEQERLVAERLFLDGMCDVDREGPLRKRMPATVI